MPIKINIFNYLNKFFSPPRLGRPARRGGGLGWVVAFILISNFNVLISPVFALDPIIITDTKHSYPTTSGDDQNYIPSNPNSTSTVSIEKTVGISESFGPQVEGQDSEGNNIYKYQNINGVKQTLDSQEINTNFYRQNFYHFAKPLADPLASPDSIRATANSFSTSNSTRHSLSAATQRCIISHQIADIATFIDGGNSLCIDREIDTSKGKIRVGEIISALINNNLGDIYYPDPNCPENQIPESFPGKVISALKKQYSGNYKYSLSLPEYQQLYLYGIEPICTNSLAQSVEHCDLDETGNKTNCKKEIRSVPLAAAASNEKLYRNYLPQQVDNASVDFAKTQNNPKIADKPNPLSWLAQFFKGFFEGFLSEDKTFSGPHSVTTKIDTRQADGLEANTTFFNNFIPASSQVAAAPASATNGVTLDPGNNNSKLEKQFYLLTQPASWQKKTPSTL